VEAEEAVRITVVLIWEGMLVLPTLEAGAEALRIQLTKQVKMAVQVLF